MKGLIWKVMKSCSNVPHNFLSVLGIFSAFLLVALFILPMLSLNSSAAAEIVDDIQPIILRNGKVQLRGTNYLETLDYWYFSDYDVYLSRNGNPFASVVSGAISSPDFTINFGFIPGDKIYVVYSMFDGTALQSSVVTYNWQLGSISGSTVSDGLVTITYIPSIWQQQNNYMPTLYRVDLNGSYVASGSLGSYSRFSFEVEESGIYDITVYFSDNSYQLFQYVVNYSPLPDVVPEYIPPSVNDTTDFYNWFYGFFDWSSGFGLHIISMVALVGSAIAMKFLFFGLR